MRSALLAAAVLSFACAKSPVEPEGICGSCAAPGTIPPPSDAVAAAMDAGRADAAQTCQVRATTHPAVEFERCRFWVNDAVSEPGGRPHGMCASGLTAPDGGRVYVSLDDPSRVLPLIRWEARNSYWLRSGCGAQAYAAPVSPRAPLGGPLVESASVR